MNPYEAFVAGIGMTYLVSLLAVVLFVRFARRGHSTPPQSLRYGYRAGPIRHHQYVDYRHPSMRRCIEARSPEEAWNRIDELAVRAMRMGGQ